MSNTKQKILSELRTKLTQFKSKIKSNKSIDEEKVDDDMFLKIPLNNKINSNKENINDNNIIIPKPTQTSKMERVNSTGISSHNQTKKLIDFDVDKFLNQSKKHSISNNNINLDEYNNKDSINKNKTFINLNLTSKTLLSKTDRNKYNFNLFKNDYLNKYDQNYTEPNNGSLRKIKSQNNYFNFNYSTNDNIIIPLTTKNKNERERFSAKPEIRTDISKYNLNFMMNNKNTNRKNSAKLLSNNYNTSNDSYSMNIKNILYSNNNTNTRKTNFNLLNGFNNKYLKPSNAAYNYNFNCYNNYNKGNLRRNFFNEFENNKINNVNLSINVNMEEIRKVKYMIQNLSSEEINSMPMSVFKEMKDLYDLIYRKFLKNNCI